jgi:hypothetical protein
MVTMTRYLDEDFIEQTLKRGKGIAQFLGAFVGEGQPAVQYLLLYSSVQGYELWLEERIDDGSEEFCDVDAFAPIHNENERQAHIFKSFAEALDFATSEFKAEPNRWVNESMLGDEYLAYKLDTGQ